MKQAFSQITIKSFDADKRIIRGIASTPTADRVEDIVEPSGAKFALPIPFLWQHMHSQPIGQVISANITEQGIEVEIELVKAEDVESESLKTRLSEAWDSIKTGLVRGLSVGFRGIVVEEIPRSWGLRFIEWEWYELSAVSVPCNLEATITEIKSIAKSLDAERKPALGNPEPPKPTEKAVVPAGDSAEKIHVVKLSSPNRGGVKL